MQKALLVTIALGAGIGLMLPAGDEAAQPPAAVARASETVGETVLERSDRGHFYANVEVNGQLVRFLVDTGATDVALTLADAERIGIPFSRDEFTTVGMGASGPVQGKDVVLDTVSLDGKTARKVDGAILDGSDISLLGQAYLGRFSVEMRGGTMRIY